MEFIHTVAVFLFVLLILVSIHEWGHFIIARKCGVRVLRFSVGFGKPFWRFYDKYGTEFAVAPIPLGGYVKMLDETDENVAPADKNKTFESRKTWQQIAILAAGPIANFILAVLLFWWLAMQEATLPSPVIGEVEPNTPAAYAGLEEGQHIIAIDGVVTPGRSDVYERLTHRLGESGSIIVTVKYPDSSDLTYDMEVVIRDWMKGSEAPDPLAGIGVKFYRPHIPALIDSVLEGSAAEDAGFLAGDEVIKVDELEVDGWQSWSEYVRQRPNQPLAVSVKRNGRVKELTLTPSLVEVKGFGKVGQAGVGVKAVSWPENMLVTRKLGITAALDKAVEDTWSNSVMVLVSIKKLLLGQISIKNLSGPIGIAKVAGDSARAGLQYYLHFMAVLSVYLGVFNLLPIPILDGGRIVFCLAEGIKGSPLSERVKMAGLQLGLMFMGVLMIMAFYNDILRL
ncbi:RIP metalloprotease RseP [Marinagarivorans cellulosilyticus]|uniref:Zinc metalloprotease n=1 Tax=Marinagarivorans cellulosilyticus TaxID=2721545 RepID=A0AAN1WH68_9GAMM|nr:RIP metalloprotease RseP [Marinagarivorans cellulosilyticus]BCD97499.1 regulator of sigma E protease [Marinagarivorans cellulosilyticus]